MADHVDASVIVPSHAGAHRLPELLAALEAQDFTGTWEVLVVLDGVVDDSPHVLTTWAQKLPLHVLELPVNQGVVAALNRGYAEARGRVLIRCDDDLTPQPDFVSRHVAWHQGTTPRGVIGPTRNVYADTPYARAYGVPADARARAAVESSPQELRWRHWAANNSVTRPTWDAHGGFDPRFRYGQDSELGWRLQHAGVELIVDHELTADHRGPATKAATRVARAYVSGVSRAAFARAHPDAVLPSTAEPAALSLAARMWTVAVGATARALTTRTRAQRLGSIIDRLLPHLPAKVGGRAVALGVEAAAQAGRRSATTDLDQFDNQKHAELTDERGETPLD